MWCTAKERVLRPVLFCSDPGSRESRATSRWSTSRLTGAVVPPSQTQRGSAHGAMPLVRVRYLRCRRHHRGKPVEVMYNRSTGGTRVVLPVRLTPFWTGKARWDTRSVWLTNLASPQGRVCCDLHARHWVGAHPGFVETCKATWLSSSSHSRTHRT